VGHGGRHDDKVTIAEPVVNARDADICLAVQYVDECVEVPPLPFSTTLLTTEPS
jgi:hypothetical protein